MMYSMIMLIIHRILDKNIPQRLRILVEDHYHHHHHYLMSPSVDRQKKGEKKTVNYLLSKTDTPVIK